MASREGRVVVRDYVEGADEGCTSWDIRRDKDRDLYQHMEFRHPKDEVPRRTRKIPGRMNGKEKRIGT